MDDMVFAKTNSAAEFNGLSDGELVNELNDRLADNSKNIERHRINIQNLFSIVAVVGSLVGAYTIGFLFYGSTNVSLVGGVILLLCGVALKIVAGYDDRKSSMYQKTATEINVKLLQIVEKYSLDDENGHGEKVDGE